MSFLSSSPHFKSKLNTQTIMLTVLMALLPECIEGVVIFGWKALVTILVSVAGCVGFEALFQFITKQKIVVKNLSAAVTGVLLALVIPPTVPVWMVLLGDLVAIVIAKGLFGGIGSNVFNPALTGRAFLFISFPAVLGANWLDPHLLKSGKTGLDAVTSATVLSQVKAGTLENFDYLQYFWGNRAGCIGETSIFWILISFAFLLVSHIIDWRAPLAMVGTVVAGTFIKGLCTGGGVLGASNDVLIALLTGGLLFGATFMITDYSTAPVTKPGRWIFGFGAGLITFLIRSFGGYPEGVMFSILIMNALAPLLNNLTGRMYGYGRKGHKRPAHPAMVQDFDIENSKPRNLDGEAAE